MTEKLKILLIVVLGMVSCSRGDIQKLHHEVVLDGYDKLPIAKSMNEKYGAWSFIVHWNIPNDPKYGVEKDVKNWQTITYLYQRYEMTYVQKVRLTKNGGQVVEPFGHGKLYLTEIRKIHGDPVASTTDPGKFQITIDGDRLKKLVDSDWNFESIGIDLMKDKPVENIEWKTNYWNRIYPLQTQTRE